MNIRNKLILNDFIKLHKLKLLFESRFINAKCNIQKNKCAGKEFWSGEIISISFFKKKDKKRQDMIYDALEEEFGLKFIQQYIGIFLAYTPEEYDL